MEALRAIGAQDHGFVLSQQSGQNQVTAGAQPAGEITGHLHQGPGQDIGGDDVISGRLDGALAATLAQHRLHQIFDAVAGDIEPGHPYGFRVDVGREHRLGPGLRHSHCENAGAAAHVETAGHWELAPPQPVEGEQAAAGAFMFAGAESGGGVDAEADFSGRKWPRDVIAVDIKAPGRERREAGDIGGQPIRGGNGGDDQFRFRDAGGGGGERDAALEFRPGRRVGEQALYRPMHAFGIMFIETDHTREAHEGLFKRFGEVGRHNDLRAPAMADGLGQGNTRCHPGTCSRDPGLRRGKLQQIR